MLILRKTLVFILIPSCLAAAAAASPYKTAAGRLTAGLPDKAKVAVLPFLYIGAGEDSRGGQVVAERLTTELAGNKKVRLLERALLEKAVSELKLSGSGLTEESSALKAGKLLAADYVVIGSLYKDNSGGLELNARAVETATGRIKTSASAGLAEDWLEHLPPLPEGKMADNAIFRLCWAGLRAIDSGDNAAARESLSKALAQDPSGACGMDSPGLGWRARGQAKLNDMDTDGALQDFETGLKAAHDSADIYAVRAAAYIRLGRPAEALKDYDALVRLQPKAARAWLERGMARALYGTKEGAVRDLTRAIELGAGEAMVYSMRGAMYIFLRKPAEAQKDLDKAAALDPDLPDVYFNRGMLYGMQGKMDKALADYESLVELEPWRPQSYLERGTCLAAMHRFDAALADFNKALELNPDYAKAYCYRGMLYRTRLRNEEALADFDKALALKPAYPEALMGRAQAYTDMGRLDAAIKDIGKVLEVEAPVKPERYYSRGILLGRLGRMEEAVKDLSRCIELGPDKPAPYEARAMAYENLGQAAKAAADREKAAALKAARAAGPAAGAGI